MSEFQSYEFQSLDRRLTTEEQRKVNELSSHIEVSPWRALVTYNYGDFRHDPLKVLTDYFDFFQYYSNWGSDKIAFKFLADLVDLATLQRYRFSANWGLDEISVKKAGAFVILSASFSDEESYYDYYEEEPSSPNLVLVRQQILQGDLRPLFLLWLHAYSRSAPVDDEEITDTDETQGIPMAIIPPRLAESDPSLEALIDR